MYVNEKDIVYILRQNSRHYFDVKEDAFKDVFLTTKVVILDLLKHKQRYGSDDLWKSFYDIEQQLINFVSDKDEFEMIAVEGVGSHLNQGYAFRATKIIPR